MTKPFVSGQLHPCDESDKPEGVKGCLFTVEEVTRDDRGDLLTVRVTVTSPYEGGGEVVPPVVIPAEDLCNYLHGISDY